MDSSDHFRNTYGVDPEHATDEQKQQEYKRLVDLATERGFKRGFVLHSYRELFGDLPKAQWDGHEGRPETALAPALALDLKIPLETDDPRKDLEQYADKLLDLVPRQFTWSKELFDPIGELVALLGRYYGLSRKRMVGDPDSEEAGCRFNTARAYAVSASRTCTPAQFVTACKRAPDFFARCPEFHQLIDLAYSDAKARESEEFIVNYPGGDPRWHESRE